MDFSPAFALLLLFPIAGDAEPPVRLSDLNAFPPKNVAFFNCTRADEHRSWIWEMHIKALASDPIIADWLFTQYCGAGVSMFAWGNLAGSMNPEMSEKHRLDCLRKLREQLGPEAYYAGRMPAPCPGPTRFYGPRATKEPACPN